MKRVLVRPVFAFCDVKVEACILKSYLEHRQRNHSPCYASTPERCYNFKEIREDDEISVGFTNLSNYDVKYVELAAEIPCYENIL